MSMTREQAVQLGELVATMRTELGLTQRELSEQLEVASGWLAGLEAGRFIEPAPERLSRIAGALGISPLDLDQMTNGALDADRAYFRQRFELTPIQAAQVQHYIQQLRKSS